MGILKLSANCSDMCAITYTDKDGKETETDGYVPEGIGIGDYVEMEIDMETGLIQNWKPVTDEQVKAALKKVS